MMASPLIPSLLSITLFFTIIIIINLLQVHSQSIVYGPITKDESTNMYTISIYLKTPLQPSNLHLDLGFYLPFYDCFRHYNSSSYSNLLFSSSLCTDLQSNAMSNCFNPPAPGCGNATCSYFPENPVTGKGGTGDMLTDKFALPSFNNPGRLGPISEIVLSCTDLNHFSKIYRGLARGSTGLATLGRFKYSLSAQISRGSSSPWIFALCLPSSSKSKGIALFNSIGPYFFSPGINAANLLTYTPLILGPIGVDTKIYYWYKSPDYYIGVTSIKVNGKSVPLNRTLLAIDENGYGGTRLSTSRPYTVLQSSIFNAVVEAFVRETGRLKYTAVAPIEPFKVCYSAAGIPMMRVGPVFPTIDLVLQSDQVVWRIEGWNSMVRIRDKEGVEVWCLGFVDGGVKEDGRATPIVIGAHQFEDNLLQFDLERQRLGFSSSLLLRNTTCANFDFKTTKY